MPDCSIVILNYRTAGLAVDCLASLVADGYVPHCAEVIVVDNCSPDSSRGILDEAITCRGWARWARMAVADRNGGFAYGNNLAIRQLLGPSREGRPRYILLLNPDTVIRPGAVEALVRFMEEHPRVGIAGGQLIGSEASPQCGGFRFPSILGELESGFRFGLVTRLLRHWVVPREVATEPRPVDWVSGASLIVRREVFEQVGLLDEAFFMYYEEVDLCRRAKAAGWEVWHVPTSRVVHLEGAASGIGQARRPRPRYWYDSRRRYFTKHHGRLYAMVAEVAFEAGYVTWRLRRPIQGKPDIDPRRRICDGLRYVIWPTVISHG